jgi:hypothetical protein
MKTCPDCESEYPETEEYFYKMKNGFSKRCRSCYNKHAKNRSKNRRKSLNELYNCDGKSKVPTLPEVKIIKKQLQQYKKDNTLICAIKCNNCGKIHEIRNQYTTYNCTCSKNLVWFTSINFLWSKLLYVSDKLEGYSLRKFDMFR